MKRDGLYAEETWRGDGAASSRGMHDEPSLGELFKRLSADMGDLVRQEVELAKSEMGHAGSAAGKSAAGFGIALVLSICGALAITAFAVIGLGDLTGGRYALWALIIGVVALGIAGIMAKSAINRLKHGLKPQKTIETIREDKAWAGRQVQEFKRDVTTDPQLTPARG